MLVGRSLTGVGTGGNNWVATLTKTNGVTGYDLSFDADATYLYVLGTQDSSTATPDALITKYTNAGSVIWSKYIDVGSLGFKPGGIQVVGSNFYIAGTGGSGSNWGVMLIKCDSDGTLVWEKLLKTTGSANNLGGKIVVDASENIYITAKITIGTKYYLFIAKVNSSGTLQWQKTLGSASYNTWGSDIDVDSSGNVYVIGTTDYNGDYDGILVKYDSSGAVVWSKTIGYAVNQYGSNGIHIDASDNIFVCGDVTSSSGYVALFDTSGTKSWAKYLSSGGIGTVKVMDVYSDDTYVYPVLRSSRDSYGNNDFMVCRMSKSDGALWYRRYLGDASENKVQSITVSDQSVYILGTFQEGGSTALSGLGCLNKAGACLQTFGGGYACKNNTSVTSASDASTVTSVSLTENAGAFTEYSPTYTHSAASLTVNRYT